MEKTAPTGNNFTLQQENVFQALIEELGDEFHSQLRIAGHFQDVRGNSHAIYLDEDRLYVNREAEERALEEAVEDFAVDGTSTSAANGSGGRWISVEAEAGRGKSCFHGCLLLIRKLHPRIK